jgi:hypothetical protein
MMQRETSLNVNDYKNKRREAKRVCRKKKRVYEMEILESIEEAKMKTKYDSFTR